MSAQVARLRIRAEAGLRPYKSAGSRAESRSTKTPLPTLPRSTGGGRLSPGLIAFLGKLDAGQLGVAAEVEAVLGEGEVVPGFSGDDLQA